MRPLKVALVGSLLWAAVALLAMPTPTQASASPSPPGQVQTQVPEWEQAVPLILGCAVKTIQFEAVAPMPVSSVRRQAVLLLWTRERVARPARRVWQVQVSPLRGSPRNPDWVPLFNRKHAVSAT